MTHLKLRSAALLLSMAAGLACTGDPPDPGPPGPGGAWIEVSLQVNGQPTRLPASVGGIVVESASFWVREMRLVADHGSEDDRLRIRGRDLDLRAGAVIFGLSQAPPGLYSRLRIDLEAPDDDDEDKGERRASLLVTGKTADGAPFSMRENDGLELDLRAGDGVELIPGMELTASVHLALDRWFNGITLTAGSGADREEENAKRLRQNIAEAAALSMRNGAPRSATAPAQ